MKAPRCKFCDRPLRAYRWRAGGPFANANAEKFPGAQWGDYGDNTFCGRTCGYKWAVNRSPLAPWMLSVPSSRKVTS